MNRLVPISGVGEKAAACLLLETGDKRLLLDLGEGPAPGQLPNVDRVGAVDAVIVSHTHRDHVGGFPLLSRLGDPLVFATEGAFSLMRGDFRKGGVLPVRGKAAVLGIEIETGRSGHAPGGVWVRLEVAGGVLYCGDICLESPLYAFDPPPPSRTVVLDASYGLDDTPQADRIAALRPAFAGGGLLLPIPHDGRGPEIAVHIAGTGITPALDDAMRGMVDNLLAVNRPYVLDAAVPALERLTKDAAPPGDARAVTLAASGSALSGVSAALVQRWANEDKPAIVFTGFMPPGSPARDLVAAGRATFSRWNVHPRLSDNVALVRATGAEIVVPAFSGAADNEAGWRAAFAPAAVAPPGPVDL